VQQDRTERRRIHWAKTKRLTFVVLAIWFVFSLLAPWYARELDGMTFLGFKLGYYLIVQGSLIVFVALIVVQNMIQDRIDDAYGVGSID
jgi:putative solute:sodium symporter small subunit